MSANDMFNKDANPAGDDANSSGSEDDEELEESFQIVKCDTNSRMNPIAMAASANQTSPRLQPIPVISASTGSASCRICSKNGPTISANEISSGAARRR